MAEDYTRPDNNNIDERLMSGQLEEANNQKNNKSPSESRNLRDSRLQSRLGEAKRRARERKLSGEGLGERGIKTGKKMAGSVKKKITRGSEGIFFALLLVAMFVDLIEYLDLGIFSSLANVGVYILVVVGGFIMWLFKNNDNKFSIFNLLKGQLWKYLIAPLFELVPLINLFPFWTGTVIMMWFKVRREKAKIIKREAEEEAKNLQTEYA